MSAKDEKGRESRPLAVELCAGAGGLTLGFEEAGFSVQAAVEIDRKAATIHRKNFKTCKVLQRSIVNLTASRLRERAGLGEAAIDVVFGGPPCQGFSQIGKRDEGDGRSEILVEFARLATELEPKVIVAENVKGVLMKWAETRRERFRSVLEAAGYVCLEPWILNAADYGVPQKRERVFLVAIREGLSLPEKPAKSSMVTPSAWDAIKDLVGIAETDRGDGHVYVGKLDPPSEFARGLRRGPRDRVRLTGCKLPQHSKEVIERFSRTPGGDTEKISRFYRLPLEGPAMTLRAGTGPDHGSYMACRPIHPTQSRCITVREAARLHGFPDDFVFDPTHWHGFRQIGNAVPPPLAKAVAQAILRTLDLSNG